MGHESDGDINCNWCSWYRHQRIDTGTGRLGKRARAETIQTTALLKSTRILRRVLETWGDLLSIVIRRVSILPLISNSTSFYSFGDRSKGTNLNWYYHHLHIPKQLELFWKDLIICLPFRFLLFSLLSTEMAKSTGWQVLSLQISTKK